MTRIYDGVEFGNADTLAKVADGHEIIYVPCHRSHMDYLLLSYVIYRNGYAIPHIAAGLNLNMPVGWPVPAQGRGVLHPPQPARQCATPSCS